MSVLQDNVLDFFYPRYTECLYCEAVMDRNREKFLCENCQGRLLKISYACKRCSYPLATPNMDYCNQCIGLETSLDRFYAGYLFDDVSRSVIYNYKYNHKNYYCEFYASLILEVIENNYKNETIEAIAIVPSTKKRKKIRGFDHVLEIAKIVSKKSNIPIYDLLIRNIQNNPQAKLGKNERALQIKNVFSLKKIKIMPKTVLLVDDIYTTGSTLEECATLLKRSNMRVIGAVMFRTIRS